MQSAELGRVALFEGLDAAALEQLQGLMQPRHFAAGDWLCRQGEPGGSLFVIVNGLGRVTVDAADGTHTRGRLRRGDIVGELSVVTGEARSASVIASVQIDALELSRDAFAAIVGRYPAILAGVSRIVSRRLVERERQQLSVRGEGIALVLGQSAMPLAGAIVAATQRSSPRPVAVLDCTPAGVGAAAAETGLTVVEALSRLDPLLATHGAVLIVACVEAAQAALLEHVDRVLIAGTAADAARTAAGLGNSGSSLELVEIGEPAELSSPPASNVHRLRTLPATASEAERGRLSGWIGRHLARTKLGLALGAGGGKGYAHVGVLQVLERAGYTVDFVSGSSIGAFAGSMIAMGRNAAGVEAAMRNAFTPEAVAETFKLSLAGTSSGLETMMRMCKEATNECSFADLERPLVVMAVDLNTRAPAPIADGLVWEALLAATALPGLFPPYMRGEQRLVDGLVLVPVPTGLLFEAGADVTISVNIMAREAMPAWPGEEPPEPHQSKFAPRMLDTLMEVMDLAQSDASARHAALAHVPITPRFGPCSWRDFHFADKFMEAGRLAATEQLPALAALAHPDRSN